MTQEGDQTVQRLPVPDGPEAEAFRSLLDDAALQESVRRIVAVFASPLCARCLGRPLSRAERGLTNPEKGALVIDRLDLPHTPDPTACPWCEGVFEETDHFSELIIDATRPYDFETILVATRVHPDIQKIDAQVQEAGGEAIAEHSEAMKTELNRVVAQTVLPRLGVEGRFDRADLVALLDPYFDVVETTPANLYLYGRYRKYDRTIPQTKWPCTRCKGRGCKRCDETGQMYPTSVEQLVAELPLELFEAKDESFHGSGREDIDALMLGTGRPFVLELKEPRFRKPRDGGDPDQVLGLDELERRINERIRPQAEVEGLRLSDKEEVVHIKEAALDKAYRAHIVADTPISRADLEVALPQITAAPLQQRTPNRVLHRRADKVRERQVHRIELVSFGTHPRAAHEEIAPNAPAPVTEGDASTHFTLDIDAESGTYIKELVHGDEGRTEPSFAGLLGVPMRVVALDVVGVGDGGDGTDTSGA